MASSRGKRRMSGRLGSGSGSVSPPAVRRKVQSAMTKSTVASFFTPASQKPPERVTWLERGADAAEPPSLLVGRYVPLEGGTISATPADGGAGPASKIKIAAFDFDSTLISTISGYKFAKDSKDWKWWDTSVPGVLTRLHKEEGYKLVVISNQAGIKLKPDPKAKMGQISALNKIKSKVTVIFNQLDLPISIYAATEKDTYRKPRTGMWDEVLKDLGSTGEIDLERSVFVGDAGGRLAGNNKSVDFSCADRNFADNVGIKYQTPEEFFLGEAPRPFTRFDPSAYAPLALVSEVRKSYQKQKDKEIVLFCGSPGAGKSTFFWTQLEPLGYVRVNQDILKSREKCLKTAEMHLREGKSVAIDSTNPDPEVRSNWIKLAKKYAVPIRCVHFTATAQLCEHNDVVRALNKSMNPEKRTILPSIAFRSFASRYQAPELTEGFEDIFPVDFQFNGRAEDRAVWVRHWL